MQQLTKSIKLFALLSTATAALFVAACGANSGSKITVETGSLQKAQFIRRADAICRDTREEFDRQLERFLRQNKKRRLELSLAKEMVETIIIGPYEKQVELIRSLGAPRGDENQIASFLNSMQRVLDRASAEPLKYVRGNNQFTEAAKLAKAYGLTGCAEDLN